MIRAWVCIFIWWLPILMVCLELHSFHLTICGSDDMQECNRLWKQIIHSPEAITHPVGKQVMLFLKISLPIIGGDLPECTGAILISRRFPNKRRVGCYVWSLQTLKWKCYGFCQGLCGESDERCNQTPSALVSEICFKISIRCFFLCLSVSVLR